MAAKKHTNGGTTRKPDVREVDHLDAIGNATAALSARDAATRALTMATELRWVHARLVDPKAPAAERAKLARLVERVWPSYLGRTEGDWGPIVAIVEAAEKAAEAYRGRDDAEGDDAVDMFVQLFELKFPEDVAWLTADARPLVASALRGCARKAGQRAKGEASKWTALAALVEAAGYGAIDGEDLRLLTKKHRVKDKGGRARP